MNDSIVAGDGGDDSKKVEQAAYARGYAAGRRKMKADGAAERYRREQQAFIDKAFLAALPACIEAHGWTSGEEKITTLQQRVTLAYKFANEALKQRKVLL